jgi:hypothetical protein
MLVESIAFIFTIFAIAGAILGGLALVCSRIHHPLPSIGTRLPTEAPPSFFFMRCVHVLQ